MKIALQQPFGKWVVFILVAFFFVSCKKNTPDPEPEPEPIVRTTDQKIRDSIYYYYKLYSIWEEKSIPKYELPSEFTDKYNSASSVLNALKGMTPAYANYAQYGGVYDRFSFIDGLNGYNINATAKLKMDRNDGYGLYISMGTVDSKVARPVIYFVEGGSPADKAGLKRSDMVTAINGETDFTVAINCDASGCKPVDPNALTNMRNRVANALEGGGLQLVLLRQDGTTYNVSLSYGSYTIDPIYHEEVYEYPSKNVGYFALSSFEEIERNNYNQQRVDASFKTFEDKHIEDLIVDLRYNTGGYVDAAVYIANKIAGTKVPDKKLMVTYICNAYMERTQKGTNGMFRDTYFSQTSTLNLRKVYFLVSEKTASAAEMLINVLKPYMNVQIIATGTHTYGKPVGFFEQIIENRVSFWPASFQLKNSAGFADYWDGLVADKPNINDYIFLPTGDTQETMLETALEDAVPGSTKKTSARLRASQHARMSLGGAVNTLPERGLLKN
ncbi:S41 family peptidase [Sphingobacterium sp. JUb56]|uniref:S41 family peptidase n=1 Tax=Sphingobacterium sp. JUb56 TaxID=2587145 RepID=UPI00160B4C2B|nr:S41 family peptidase [Sphingobacterium sp. JUb56]MBB2954304.1 C-terminal processing protease CtpA/Prc [Sphingobacterium sp. JUb56]